MCIFQSFIKKERAPRFDSYEVLVLLDELVLLELPHLLELLVDLLTLLLVLGPLGVEVLIGDEPAIVLHPVTFERLFLRKL